MQNILHLLLDSGTLTPVGAARSYVRHLIRLGPGEFTNGESIKLHRLIQCSAESSHYSRTLSVPRDMRNERRILVMSKIARLRSAGLVRSLDGCSG